MTSTTPLAVLFSNWLAEAESSLDESTAQQYKVYVKANYLPFFDALESITTESCRDYARARLLKVKRKTVLKELSALRGFIGWCVEQRHLLSAPTIVSPPRKAVGTARFERKVVEFEARGGRAHPPCVSRARPGRLPSTRVLHDYAKGRGTLTIRDEIDKARYGRDLPLTERARTVLDRVASEQGVRLR